MPLLLLAGVVGWKWKESSDDGEIRGLRAERDLYKSHLDLVKDKSEGNAGELAAIQRDVEEIKRQINTGVMASAFAALAADVERRAITLTSSNNEIRAIVSEPVSIREEPLPIIRRSTSETVDG